MKTGQVDNRKAYKSIKVPQITVINNSFDSIKQTINVI